jgi:hypothetical protein
MFSICRRPSFEFARYLVASLIRDRGLSETTIDGKLPFPMVLIGTKRDLGAGRPYELSRRWSPLISASSASIPCRADHKIGTMASQNLMEADRLRMESKYHTMVADQPSQRNITTDEAEQLARQWGVPYIEVSSLFGWGLRQTVELAIWSTENHRRDGSKVSPPKSKKCVIC